MCVPLTDVSKCPHWLALLGFVLFHLKAQFCVVEMHKESFVAGELLCVVKCHPQQWRWLDSMYTQKEALDLPRSPVCHVLSTQYIASHLEFQRWMRNHCRFLVHFGIFQIEACVDCLINLLHVGNIVFLLRRLPYCPFWSCYKVMGEGLECFCCSEIVLCSLSMRLPFPAYLLRVKDHYNKLWMCWPGGHDGQFQKITLYQVTFIIQNSNIKMLWTVTVSICCNGVWPCFMFLEILFNFGSWLVLSSCFASLVCKSMETGIGGNSFFHLCGHEGMELFL